jgi:hypothetical protein
VDLAIGCGAREGIMLLFAERCVHGCLGKEKKKTSKTAESIVIPAHAD